MSFDPTDALKGFWECTWRTVALDGLRRSGAGGPQLPCVLPASSCSVTGQLPRGEREHLAGPEIIWDAVPALSRSSYPLVGARLPDGHVRW